MKKLIILIGIILICSVSFGQMIVQRSNPATTPLDPNLFTSLSFRVPVFNDTTAANAVTSLDSCGKQFYNRGTASMWYRACIGASERKWIEISVSSSPTISAWLTRGNDLSTQSLPNRLGTKNGDGLNIITNDLIRMIVPVGGIVRSSSAQNKYLMQDTVGKELYYGDASSSGWELTGNAGTVAGTNFVGTTDAIDLVLKRNSAEGLRLSSGVVAVSGNMSLVTTSSSSTGVLYKGANYFMHNFKLGGTDGENLFLGALSGNFTMTGSSGIQGSYNTGVGTATLYQNTTGFRNAAFGTYALQNNTTGFSNNAFGQSALFLNTTGYNNSAFGTRALLFNTSGHSNNAHGTDALFANTTGTFNSAFSIDALYQNTIGSYNSAFGDSTFWIATTGFKNSAFGSRSGYYLGDVDSNYASVKDSMVTFLGADASRDNSISYNTALKNLTVIGYNAKGLASNQVVLGNNDVTTTLLKGSVGIQNTAPVALLTLGTAGSTLGSFSAAGNTSGVITFNPQSAAGTYNWNWPTTAGTSGYFLTSGGGGASAMTWTNPASLSTSLTSTYIGYGSAGNAVTGDANLTYTAASSAVALDSGYLSFTGHKNYGSAVNGSIFRSSLYGLTTRAVAGSSYDWLLFSAGGNTILANPTGTDNFLTSGKFGFGSLGLTPSALVNIAAGTATANTAPLKFTSGTNLTTAEAGAVEYNGSNFFMTATATNRRQVALSNVATPTSGYLLVGNGTDWTITAPGSVTGLNYISALTNGVGTTANGTAVDLGGTVGANVAIDEDGGNDNSFDIGRNTAFSDIRLGALNFTLNGGPVQMNNYGAGAATFDASGNITSVSDMRLKNLQGMYGVGLKQLMQINPIVYKYNAKSKLDTVHNYIGFSAQNVKGALGENAVGVNKDGYYSLQDRAIMAAMVNSIKELKELNDIQQKEIDNLKKEVRKFKK